MSDKLNILLRSACRDAQRECEADLPEGWQKLVLHVEIGNNFKRCWGHAFDAAGNDYATSADSGTMETFTRLQEAMQAENGRAWRICRVVIAPDGAFDVEFEYDKPGRFRVTPDNVYERIDECRALPVPTAQQTFSPPSGQAQHAMLLELCISAVIKCGARLPDDWQKLVLCGLRHGFGKHVRLCL